MSAVDALSVVFCPSCAHRYVLGAGVAATPDVVLLCTACGEGHPLPRDNVVTADSASAEPGGLAMQEAAWPRVVVGHEVPAVARAVADALRRGHLAPVCVRTGDAVLAAIDPAMPEPAAAIVLDVAVPGLMAFEIIDAVRQSPTLQRVPIVLLASVYEKTRYKRRPNRLYGADAYLELHHVPDRLAEVITGLLDDTRPGDERTQAPVERARAAGLRLGPPSSAGPRTIARRLISDVALYHGDEVARGVREGTPLEHVRPALDAARALHTHACGEGAVFDDEVAAFSARLLDARGGRQLG